MNYNRQTEALAMAMALFSGYFGPPSELSKAKNPGGLRVYSMAHRSTESGYRVFKSFIDGMQALLFDLNAKMSGNNWSELTSTSTLKDLAASYSLPEHVAESWVMLLKAALNDDTITSDLPLSYFTK